MPTAQTFGNHLAEEVAKGLAKGHQVIANLNEQNYIVIGIETMPLKPTQERIRLTTYVIHAYFFDFESFKNWLANRTDNDFEAYNSTFNLLTKQLLENELRRWQKTKTTVEATFYDRPPECEADDLFIRYANEENYISINSKEVSGSASYGEWDPHGPFSEFYVEDFETASYKFSHIGPVVDYLRFNKFVQ